MLALAGSLSVTLMAPASPAFPSPATASALSAPPPEPDSSAKDSDSSIKSTSTSTTTSSPNDTDTDTATADDDALDDLDTADALDDGDDDTRHTLAEQARKKCKPRSFFRFHSFRPRNFFVPRTRFIDGPGGTMTVSVTRQHRVYAEMEIERERYDLITTGDLIRQLRNMVNPLLAEEYIVETGHEYEQEITDGKYGNMWYRVFGYRVGFSAWRQLYTCRVRKVTTGVANVPARVEGWRYWETDHPMYKGRRLSRR
ncbi:hypothetical protein [Streptosporangium sp. OZ121]|uniref:hypothetical protein n=1 Tax=Streptosporangium sp. OZ121 TaxID=3444183 RepID=UPI003F7913B7